MIFTPEMERAFIDAIGPETYVSDTPFGDTGNWVIDGDVNIIACLNAALSVSPAPAVGDGWTEKKRKLYDYIKWSSENAGGMSLDGEDIDVLLAMIAASPAPATPSEVEQLREENERLTNPDAPMACGGDDDQMTAAEEVLAWLLIEKIGAPDDVPYTPNQAQEIIAARIDQARQLEEIDAMLREGQGDDSGPQILPDFEKGMTVLGKVEACLHLLERRRDVIAASPATDLREENEQLKAKLEELQERVHYAEGTADANIQRAITAEALLEKAREALDAIKANNLSGDEFVVGGPGLALARLRSCANIASATLQELEGRG